VHEFDVRNLRHSRAPPSTFEQVVAQIRADDAPGGLTTRDRLREGAVATARVEDVQRAAGGELLEPLGDELAAQTSRGRE
jgi:hypothetical protein